MLNCVLIQSLLPSLCFRLHPYQRLRITIFGHCVSPGSIIVWWLTLVMLIGFSGLALSFFVTGLATALWMLVMFEAFLRLDDGST